MTPLKPTDGTAALEAMVGRGGKVGEYGTRLRGHWCMGCGFRMEVVGYHPH